MMEEIDLDSFIANIEESAPQEDLDDNQHRCQQCNVVLEDIDGVFICPNCGAQATDILQLEETEIHYDEMGHAALGQRVRLTKKQSKHSIEYGWAWSTDEAIVHLLNLQVTALEKLGLVPEIFRQGIKNMWFKFWIDYVAPFIKDDYNEQDFVPLPTRTSLKERDIEVLIKVRDKVMIPIKQEKPQQARKNRYKMLDIHFDRSQPPDPNQSSSSEDEITDPANVSLNYSLEDISLIQDEQSSGDEIQPPRPISPCPTRNINSNSITILTLNRTLAFIEATARCMNLPDPIFASDIVRACNQRTIPFYGAHKTLPEGILLNPKDKLMFQKTRPPSPVQLTRAATVLIFKIYDDKLPFKLPVPNFRRVLDRLVTDMNLPLDLSNHIVNSKTDFSSFRQTRQIQLVRGPIKYLPQYDKWAYAILVSYMKKLFNLSDKSIQAQRKLALAEQEKNGETLFILREWVRQMSLRIQLIMCYDPFVLFHPLADINNIQPTSQVLKYVETILDDRVTSTTRTKPNHMRFDDAFRSEMTDFLKREIPKPAHLVDDEPDGTELDRPVDVRHPLQDALIRTSKFWEEEVAKDEEISDLIFKDFTSQKIITQDRVEKWSIFEEGSGNLKHEISPDWPYCYKLLLFVGGYLFHCEPRELLREVKFVEQYISPTIRRRPSRRKSQ